MKNLNPLYEAAAADLVKTASSLRSQIFSAKKKLAQTIDPRVMKNLKTKIQGLEFQLSRLHS